MDRRISATVHAEPEPTMAALSDLGSYPAWLSLVHDARPDETDVADAWMVTLRARLGPLARSKRLRMVRTELTDRSVRFERQELDGRDHAEWVLSATVAPSSEHTCEVNVHLHYGGALWSAPLEIVLATFEGSAADRLSKHLTASA